MIEQTAVGSERRCRDSRAADPGNDLVQGDVQFLLFRDPRKIEDLRRCSTRWVNLLRVATGYWVQGRLQLFLNRIGLGLWIGLLRLWHRSGRRRDREHRYGFSEQPPPRFRNTPFAAEFLWFIHESKPFQSIKIAVDFCCGDLGQVGDLLPSGGCLKEGEKYSTTVFSEVLEIHAVGPQGSTAPSIRLW